MLGMPSHVELLQAQDRYGERGYLVQHAIERARGLTHDEADALAELRSIVGYPPVVRELCGRLDQEEQASLDVALTDVGAAVAQASLIGSSRRDAYSQGGHEGPWPQARVEAILAVSAVVAYGHLSNSERAGLLGPWKMVVEEAQD